MTLSETRKVSRTETCWDETGDVGVWLTKTVMRLLGRGDLKYFVKIELIMITCSRINVDPRWPSSGQRLSYTTVRRQIYSEKWHFMFLLGNKKNIIRLRVAHPQDFLKGIWRGGMSRVKNELYKRKKKKSETIN